MSRDEAAATEPGCAWMIGLVLGAVTAVMLLEFGPFGLGFLGLLLGLIAWKGPRAMGFAGVLTGIGGALTLLFGRVWASCAAQNASIAGSCGAGDIESWTAGAAAIFLLGLVSTWLAIRRRR